MSSAACIFCKIIKGSSYIHSYITPSYALRLSSRHTSSLHSCLTDMIPLWTGDIPSFKLFESEKVFAFLDIQPLSRGHAVRIPYVPILLPRTASVIETASYRTRLSVIPWLFCSVETRWLTRIKLTGYSSWSPSTTVQSWPTFLTRTCLRFW